MTTTEVSGTLQEVVGERLGEVADTAGEVMRGAGEAVREADRTLRGSSDQVLGLLAALSVGLAIGFVASGASRLLVAASLVPAAMVAGVLAERMDQETRSATGRRSPVIITMLRTPPARRAASAAGDVSLVRSATVTAPSAVESLPR